MRFSLIQSYSIIIGTKHDTMIKILKIKLLNFVGFENVDVFEFIIDFDKSLYKRGIIEKHVLSF